ncbi:MAG TPA: hypothetical protein PK163_10240, partial [Steroidobacteraceae bacterium]|nr:hypothetical protein [Steroidobacteraceae bacterium]
EERRAGSAPALRAAAGAAAADALCGEAAVPTVRPTMVQAFIPQPDALAKKRRPGRTGVVARFLH